MEARGASKAAQKGREKALFFAFERRRAERLGGYSWQKFGGGGLRMGL